MESPTLNLCVKCCANVSFSSLPPRDSDSKNVKNDCYRPGEEERPKIQLRECNGTQQEEVEFKKQEGRAGCDGGVVRYFRVLDTMN